MRVRVCFCWRVHSGDLRCTESRTVQMCHNIICLRRTANVRLLCFANAQTPSDSSIQAGGIAGQRRRRTSRRRRRRWTFAITRTHTRARAHTHTHTIIVSNLTRYASELWHTSSQRSNYIVPARCAHTHTRTRSRQRTHTRATGFLTHTPCGVSRWPTPAAVACHSTIDRASERASRQKRNANKMFSFNWDDVNLLPASQRQTGTQTGGQSV